MKDFKKFSKSGRGGGFGRRGGDDRQMHEAVCANCGKPCKVPFKPTGDKPVYCNDCFSQTEGRDGARVSGPKRGNSPFSNRSHGRKDFQTDNTQKQLEEINHKLDLLLKKVAALS